MGFRRCRPRGELASARCVTVKKRIRLTRGRHQSAGKRFWKCAGAAWVLFSSATAGLEAQENVMRRAASPPVLNRFVKVDALNVSALLPPPPAPDSMAGKAD